MYIMQFHSLFHVNYFINAFFLFVFVFSFLSFFLFGFCSLGARAFSSKRAVSVHSAHVRHIFAIILEHISKLNGMSTHTWSTWIVILFVCSYCCFHLCASATADHSKTAKILTKFFCSSSFSVDLYSIDLFFFRFVLFKQFEKQREHFMRRKYI